jgi:hypothetical protein
MRIIFDVDSEAQVCGSGRPYRNKVGFQGVDDMHASLTLIIGEDEKSDLVEFEGPAKHIIKMLHEATEELEDLLSVMQKDIGPKRPAPCPNCQLDVIYPNVTHTQDCAVTKMWQKAVKDVIVE